MKVIDVVAAMEDSFCGDYDDGLDGRWSASSVGSGVVHMIFTPYDEATNDWGKSQTFIVKVSEG